MHLSKILRRSAVVVTASWSSIGTFASLLGVFALIRPSTGFTLLQYIALLICGVLSFIASAVAIRRNWFERVTILKGHQAIDKFMVNWVDCDGRCSIFSNDLSWVQRRRENREILETKAKRRELTLFLPSRNDLANELELLGAELHVYDGLDFIPRSRFTIINDNRIGAEVAIGSAGTQGRWVIEQFRRGDDSAFDLANDLLEVLRRVAPSQ